MYIQSCHYGLKCGGAESIEQTSVFLNKLFLKGKTRVISFRNAFKKETNVNHCLNFPRAGF